MLAPGLPADFVPQASHPAHRLASIPAAGIAAIHPHCFIRTGGLFRPFHQATLNALTIVRCLAGGLLHLFRSRTRGVARDPPALVLGHALGHALGHHRLYDSGERLLKPAPILFYSGFLALNTATAPTHHT